MEGSFSKPRPGNALVGMQVGPVYRLKITNIPANPGEEVFPTLEIIDRLYPPSGLALRFPIPVELTQNELEMALDGMLVTRVIYVEDPSQALPVDENPDEQPWIEARHGEDPLVVADQLGRPVAILRIGGRVPTDDTGSDAFAYGSPPLVEYDAEQCATAGDQP